MPDDLHRCREPRNSPSQGAVTYSGNYVGGYPGGNYRLCVTLYPGGKAKCNNYIGTSGSLPTITQVCPAFGTNAVEAQTTVYDSSNGNLLDSAAQSATCTEPTWDIPPQVDPTWQETGGDCAGKWSVTVAQAPDVALTLVADYGDFTSNDSFTIPPGSGSYTVYVQHMFPGVADSQPYYQSFTIAETGKATSTTTYHGTAI